MSYADRKRDEDFEWRGERDLAETEVCDEPGCFAAVGAHCVNLDNGEPLEGQPAHWRRIKKARSRPASGPTATNGGG
jgi:hypothetical protein